MLTKGVSSTGMWSIPSGLLSIAKITLGRLAMTAIEGYELLSSTQSCNASVCVTVRASSFGICESPVDHVALRFGWLIVVPLLEVKWFSFIWCHLARWSLGRHQIGMIWNVHGRWIQEETRQLHVASNGEKYNIMESVVEWRGKGIIILRYRVYV